MVQVRPLMSIEPGVHVGVAVLEVVVLEIVALEVVALEVVTLEVFVVVT